MSAGFHGTVFQINVSRGGVPKTPVEEAEVTLHGVAGDRQADRRYHGNPGQELCLFSVEKLAALAAEGHHVGPGSTGENLTLEGVDWALVVPGRRLRLGEDVLIEVTAYASPCTKNARWFKRGDFNRINQKTNPGFSRVYARVLEPGHLRTGDPVEVISDSAGERATRLQPHTYRWPRDFARS